MITLESALKILKKYGYNSKTVHPYLYKNNNEIGLNYSYIDSKYGITERVATFYSELELDKFLKRFQWYKLNGRKHNVTMRLNNYEVSKPEVLYIRNNHVMTDKELFDIESFDKKEKKNKKLSHTKRLLLEVENLMDRYYIEKETIEKFTNNLYGKERELSRYYLELQKLIDKYNRVKRTIESDNSYNKFNPDLKNESEINSKLSEYKSKLPSNDKVLELVNKVWFLNKDLELDKNYMYALKVNDDIDEEMRLVVTKLDFMKELLSKKRFKIVNLKKKFNSIDSQSTYESLYDENFEKKYADFVEKKYDVLDKIDEFRLCEYLNNFKTNKAYDIEKNIERCKTDSNLEFKSIEEISKYLRRQYNNNLSDDEKYALTLYSSSYHQLFDLVGSIYNYNNLSYNRLLGILNEDKSFEKCYKDCYTNIKKIIDLDENRLIKETIFKNINFDSKEKFIESIRDNVNIIANIDEKIVLKDDIKLYFSTEDFDSLGKDKFIVTSSIIAPLMLNNDNENYRVINAHVKKGINVLFSPQSISLPFATAYNKEIKIINIENPEIIIDTRDVNINKDANLTIYSKFKTHMVKKNDYSYIDKISNDYKININKVVIEKRNKDE